MAPSAEHVTADEDLSKSNNTTSNKTKVKSEIRHNKNRSHAVVFR